MKKLLILLAIFVSCSIVTFGQNYPHGRTMVTPEYVHQGNATVSGTMDVTGVTTTTGALDVNGGVLFPTHLLAIYTAGGAPQAVTDGSSQAADDGDRHFSQIYVPYTATVTGIFYLVGATGGTDSVVCELFDASGDLVPGATTVASATASGDIVGTAAEIQNIAFTDGAITIAPGVYYVSVQFDGTTATYAAYEVAGSMFVADEDDGTAWTPASITPGTAYVDAKGPIGGIY